MPIEPTRPTDETTNASPNAETRLRMAARILAQGALRHIQTSTANKSLPPMSVENPPVPSER